MRITTAKKYYGCTTNFGSDGIIIEFGKYTVDMYLTKRFKVSTMYAPPDDYITFSYIVWLGWLRIEISGRMEMEA
jgi:hypothetical protein